MGVEAAERRVSVQEKPVSSQDLTNGHSSQDIFPNQAGTDEHPFSPVGFDRMVEKIKEALHRLNNGSL